MVLAIGRCWEQVAKGLIVRHGDLGVVVSVGV